MPDISDFEKWFSERYGSLVAALTVVLGDAHAAEESSAEAFVRAYERWERVRRMESPGGWLYQVALNHARRRARRQVRERELLTRFRPRDGGPITLEPELWAAVRELTDRQRTAIALRYVLDLPETEVAEVMGVARGTASATLATARRRLEALLAPLTVEPAPESC